MEGTYINMKIAENCPSYRPHHKLISASSGVLPTSCNTCKSFLNDQCIEKLHDSILDEISFN